MKKIKKILQTCLILIFTFSLMAIAAYAETDVQDGLELTVSTDKSSYSASDTISVELAAKNTGDYDLLNVGLEVIVPNGYHIENGLSARQNMGNMRENASVSMTVDLVPGDSSGSSSSNSKGSSSNGSNSSGRDSSGINNSSGNSSGSNNNGKISSTIFGNNAKTSDNSNLILWLVILGLAVVGIVVVIVVTVVLVIKNGKSGKLLSLILVFFMFAGTGAAGMPKAEAIESTKQFSITKILDVGTNKVAVTWVATYELSERITSNNFTIAFDSNGGSAVPAQRIAGGEQAVEPEAPTRNGYRFVAWYSDAGLTTVYDFEQSVVSDLTLYACWEEEVQETYTILDEPEEEVEIYSFNTDTWDIMIGTEQTVIFTAEIFADREITENEVFVCDETGAQLGYMSDNGDHGDVTAGDGIYTLQVTLSSDEVHTVTYYAGVGDIRSSGLTLGFYQELTVEDFEVSDQVVAEINEAISAYIDENGYLLEGAEEDARTAVIGKLEELTASGIIESYSGEGNDFSIQLTNGVPFVYELLLNDGTEEGTGEVSIATFQPFKNTWTGNEAYLNDNSWELTDENASRIDSSFDEYSFNSATQTSEINITSDDNFDLDEVTLDSLKNLSNYGVILWNGHGGYNLYGNEGASIAIGQLTSPTVDSTYSAEIQSQKIIKCAAMNRSVYAITGGFIQEYVGDMTDAFVYLGACDTGMDMENGNSNKYSLVQSFINKGAAAVVGSTGSLDADYDHDIGCAMIEEMCKESEGHNYATAGEALAIAKDNNHAGPQDSHGTTMNLYPQNSAAASNYRFKEIEKGSIAGNVVSASDSSEISNALIRVYNQNGDEIDKARTDANGFYTIDVPIGSYVVKVSSGSYKSVKMAVTVTENETTYNETFLLLNAGLSLGYANGTITHSVTGVAVPDVTIKVRSSWNNRTGSVVATTTTNENGYYELSTSINLICGSYTIEYSKSGYVTGYKNIILSPVDYLAQDAAISPVVSDGVYRIVLTWGTDPRDMDSHLEGTLPSGDWFHVYYRDKSAYDDGSEVCNLDLDDVTSYGPETVTLYAEGDKDYYYYIYKYAGNGTTASSNSKVVLYKGNTIIQTFNVPIAQGDGRYWNVFAIKNGRLVVKNTITNEADTAY